MNTRLIGLVLLAVLAVAGGLWLNFRDTTNDQSAQLLFPDGRQYVQGLQAISFDTSQGTLLQAELDGETWLAKVGDDAPSYPLDKARLTDFLTALTQAKLVEAKTSKAENYHHLGLESIDNVDSLATLVTLTGKQSNNDWQVLVGNSVNTGTGNYVRLPRAAQSWKIDQAIALPSDKYTWLQRPILPFNSTDIAALKRSDGKTWVVEKSENEQFVLKTLPKGRELRYPGIVDSVVSSLVELDFDGLLARDASVWLNASNVAKLLVSLSDGSTVSAQIKQLDTDYYVQFASEQHSAYWLEWTYQISSFNAQQLAKNLEDFLVEVKPIEPLKKAGDEVEEGEAPN
jgi:hypothetical protein